MHEFQNCSIQNLQCLQGILNMIEIGFISCRRISKVLIFLIMKGFKLFPASFCLLGKFFCQFVIVQLAEKFTIKASKRSKVKHEFAAARRWSNSKVWVASSYVNAMLAACLFALLNQAGNISQTNLSIIRWQIMEK